MAVAFALHLTPVLASFLVPKIIKFQSKLEQIVYTKALAAY